ncbi:MAG: electron transfer flavoprotein subunit alpha/FixB family protein [Firmicutes bacterium]|nr:electron transfer flavoprotein subunit alpha/FixB family protein [Bacillota bacterium]
MQKKVWAISEQPKILAELVGGARSLFGEGAVVTAAALGSREGAEAAAAAGAGKVYCFNLENGAAVEDLYRPLFELIKMEGADLILVGATKRGKTLAALLAAALDSGLATEAVIESVADGIAVRRLVYGGLAVSTGTFVSGIPVVTVPGRTWEVPASGEAGAAIVETDGMPGRIRVLERRARARESADLESAEVVITIGRGVKKKEDLAMFEELAELLGGVLACTRPVAEEEGYHWFPEDSYIGISGRIVKPHLYLSVGSSGQVQHLAGCRDARVLVGIDKNEDAPIFEACDYGVVGDLYQVIPELIKKIKEARAS